MNLFSLNISGIQFFPSQAARLHTSSGSRNAITLQNINSKRTIGTITPLRHRRHISTLQERSMADPDTHMNTHSWSQIGLARADTSHSSKLADTKNAQQKFLLPNGYTKPREASTATGIRPKAPVKCRHESTNMGNSSKQGSHYDITTNTHL